MDSKFQVLGPSCSMQNAFEINGKTQVKFDPCTDIMEDSLCLQTTSIFGPSDLSKRGVKRKWCHAGRHEELEDDLSLRLSPSSSDGSSTSSTSVCTNSPGRESDQEISMDIELNFHLQLGSSDEKMKSNNDTRNIGKMEELGCQPDSKLNHSAASSASTITTGSPISVHRRGFCVQSLPNALQAVSAASTQAKPLLKTALPSSSVSCISDRGHLEYQGSTSNWIQAREAGAKSMASLCFVHDSWRMCKADGCQNRDEDGTLHCVRHEDGHKRVQSFWRPREGFAFCAHHLGGKRCQVKGCSKSSNPSMDFCKCHGGHKKCHWGHPGMDFGKGEPPCSQYAQGKNVLCAAHQNLVQDQRVHGGRTMVPDGASKTHFHAVEEMSLYTGYKQDFMMTGSHPSPQIGSNHQCANDVTEGRVHGGSLIAILRNGAEECGMGNHDGTGLSTQDAQTSVLRENII